MKIIRLRVVNFKGVELFDQAIPEHGVMISGGNARGKSSLLHAIRSALVARDIDPSAIRIGADKSEILVDMTDFSVRRGITASGSSLKVSLPNGDAKSKPAHFLNDLLGTAPLDPIELFLEKDPKKRRALILAALPIKLTRAHIEKWVPEEWRGLVPDLSASRTAGLDALAHVRKVLYEKRASANAEHKAVIGGVANLEASLAEMPKSEGARPLAEVEGERQAAYQALHKARGDIDAAARARDATAGARAIASKFREEARDHRGKMGTYTEYDKLWIDAKEAQVADLKRQLTDAQSELQKAYSVNGIRTGLQRDADDKDARAAQLEASFRDPPCPAAEEVFALEDALRLVETERAKSMQADERRQLEEQLANLRIDEGKLSKAAGRLTHTVDILTHAAQAELIAESQGIQGLGISEDGAITLDGVTLDALSGAEQLKFATEVAKRANAKAKILLIDNLERLDPDAMPVFIRDATAGGYQLLATRVASGDVVIEAIQPDDEPAQAEVSP